MIPDFSGKYLNFESTNDGDIVEILDEGSMQYNDILKKDMFNIQVKKGDKVMTWSPSDKVGRSLQDAFGKDTHGWIGKKLEIVHVDKKMLVRAVKN